MLIQKIYKCTKCKKIVDMLDLFPGDICLECYKLTPESRQEYNQKLFIKAVNLK